MELPMYLDEDEEVEDEMEFLEKARYEIIEYILRKYGILSSKDIAKIMNWKTKEVNLVLKDLESWGRIKRTKMGRIMAWAHIEEHIHNPMFY